RRVSFSRLGGRRLAWYEAPELAELVVRIARRAGLKPPALYLFPAPQANALTMATAQESAIGVTPSLLQHLQAGEVAAVIAHEVAHIRHGDLLLAGVASGLAGAATLLAEMGRWGVILGFLLGLPVSPADLLVALAVAAGVPALALLLRAALSREREFLADAGAAQLLGSPELMARALWRLEQVNRATWWQRLLGLAPRVEESNSPFSSHPPTRERIRRLQAMDHLSHWGGLARAQGGW
ncbi:MAG: M48 family metalloprotease, partial [Pseudomonadota bacterium]